MNVEQLKTIISKLNLSKFFLQSYLEDKMDFSLPLSMAKGRSLKIGKRLLVKRVLLQTGEAKLEDQELQDPLTGYTWRLSGLKQSTTVEFLSDEENKLLDSIELDFKKKSSKTESPSETIDEDLD